MTKAEKKRTHASRNAIERIYINMRHLFNRGKYKPTGMSGESLMQSLLILQPEIYGHIAHKECHWHKIYFTKHPPILMITWEHHSLNHYKVGFLPSVSPSPLSC